MRKVNFNNLDNIEIPDSWADKAIEIPNTPVKDPPFILFRLSRTLIAVASVVLVCTLSITLCLFIKNDSPISIASPTQGTIETVESLKATEKSLNPDSNKSGENIEPTLNPISATQKPTIEPMETIVEAKTEPTEKETSKPTVKPTQNSSQKPTYKPAEKPTEKPTSDFSTESIPPTFGPDGIEDEIDYVVSFPLEKLSGQEKVLFSIELKDNEYSDSVSPEVIPLYNAEIKYIHDGTVFVSFNPVDLGIVDKSGTYNIYLYNAKEELVYSGQIQITI